MEQPLVGRIALVTGASRGIGRATAVALARAGCDVCVNYRSRAADADAVVTEIKSLGRRAVPVQADVANSAGVNRLVRLCREQLGPITVLVNNAGIAEPRTLDTLSEQDFDRAIAVNLKSAFLLTQAVLLDMRAARWGRILNMSSVAAQLGGVVGPHYAASKAALHGLTHAYAGLLAKEGITVNAIAPALIDTDMVGGNLKASPDKIPVGRFGQSEEVAAAVVFAAVTPYLTGQTLSVNGGWYMT
ncbi:MAG TPA: 3-oxoacyl-ACP reductase family protein [Tepidisphaeraceae bacterium]|nr:3-oxoacyl-ACP reductase family protein [Tepidisphaeraceae bacterium]